MGTGNLLGNLTNYGEVTCDRLASRPGGVKILLAACATETGIRVCLGPRLHFFYILTRLWSNQCLFNTYIDNMLKHIELNTCLNSTTVHTL